MPATCRAALLAILCVALLAPTPARSQPVSLRPDHPRLLITQDNAETIRARIQNPSSVVHQYYADVLAYAIENLAETPDPDASNIDQRLLSLALVYALGPVDGFDYTGHAADEFSAAAIAWLRVYADKYHFQGPNSGYAAHDVYDMSLAYDWIHDRLSADDKVYILERLISASDHMKAFDCKYWFSDYTLGCYSHTVAGLAFWGDDVPLDFTLWWEQYGDPQHTEFSFSGSSDVKAAEYIDSFISQLIDESYATWDFATMGGGSFQSMLGHSGDLFMWLRVLDAWRTATGEDLISGLDLFTQHPFWWTYGLVPYLKNLDSTGSGCGDALVNTDNEPFYSDLLAQHTDSAVTGAALLSTLMPDSDAAALWQWFVDSHLYFRYTMGVKQKIFLVLWYDDTIEARSPADLGLPTARLFGTLDGGDPTGATRHAGGPGIVLMRSAWEDPDATLAIFKPRPFIFLHQDRDSNSFAIYRKGYLAIDSGKYLDGDWADHEANYTYRSIAHNTVHVYDPDEDFGSNRANDGGQRISGGEMSLIANYQVGSGFDIGGITAFESEADKYVYVEADATRAYQSSLYADLGNAPKVEQVRRKFIFLQSPGAAQDYFVVWDWVVTADPALRTYWMLHSKYRPELEGPASGGSAPNAYGGTPGTEFATDRFASREKRGLLFTDTLLPADHLHTLIGGPDAAGTPNTDDSYEFVVDGQQHKTGDPQYAISRYRPFFGAWRVEVEGSLAQSEHLFLHVLYPRDIDGIIVDDADPGFSTTGRWTSAQSGLELLGDHYAQAAEDSGATARWTPDLPQAGTYDVYILFNESGGCQGVPVAVQHRDGAAQLQIDQGVVFDGVLAGDWYLLGSFDFEAGTAGYVELTAQATCEQYRDVQADAVRFVPHGYTPFTDTPGASLIPSSDGEMAGAFMGTDDADKLVMLSRTGQARSSVMYAVESSKRVEHLIGDLEPSFRYSVYHDAALFSEIVASSAGVIFFSTDGGGAFQITQGDYVNQPPVALAGEDQSIEDADGDGAEEAGLDGTASYDVDGSIAAYRWLEGAQELASGPSARVRLPVGRHEIDLVVTDDQGAEGRDRVAVTIRASIAPDGGADGSDAGQGDAGPESDAGTDGGDGSGAVQGSCGCAGQSSGSSLFLCLLLAAAWLLSRSRQSAASPRG
ncbi:MAG: hypothetical protein JXR96_30800 [Deltaproteobacteria bacterium]|nr:hypothetical protein [Deltaproteobacteria bacterium]